jgi:hypothetical protein
MLNPIAIITGWLGQKNSLSSHWFGYSLCHWCVSCISRSNYLSINNHKIMLTIYLFIALLILCWLTFKSIDWFEKI